MGKAITLAFLVWIPAAGWQRSRLQDLPKLTITDLPAEVRDQVRGADDDARKNPQDARASGKLGMLMDLYHRPNEAAACYRRAHQLDASEFRWLYYLGSLQARQGNHREAAETLRAALRLKPDYLSARLKLAESLLAGGDPDASREIYSAIVAEYPAAPEAYYGLGRIALAKGEATAAGQSFTKACELFPSYGAAHYQLAQVSTSSGKSKTMNANWLCTPRTEPSCLRCKIPCGTICAI